jgi:dTDP-D-glucose 4,6-dehydratase
VDFAINRKCHDFRYVIDETLLKQKLEWEPVMNFTEGMKTLMMLSDEEQQ